MKQMVCIVCPRGCRLTVSDEPGLPVSGNACPRGEAYGKSEATDPRRSVTATCAISGLPADIPLSFPRRIPVRTTAPIPKDDVFSLVAELMKIQKTLPVKEGQLILDKWKGTDVSVVATRSLSLPEPDDA